MFQGAWPERPNISGCLRLGDEPDGLLMPRYFFDLTDRNVFSLDSVGSELPDLRSSEDEAAKAIVDIARDAMPDGTFRQLAFQARDEQGNHLLR
jgi:hypothetical protein